MKSLIANRVLGGPLALTPSGLRTATTAVAPIDWGLLSDLAARAVIVVLFSMMTVRFTQDFLASGRVTGLMLVVSELLVVVMTLFRRHAASVDRGVRARTLTALSMIGPPLVRPAALVALAPQLLTAGISVAGLLVVIGGKLSLGRSFGLMPANRGIVSTGLYRVVRHPIYMGYLVTHVAFIAANPSLWNVILLVTADIALLARAVCEEGTLAEDPAYREYQTRVRWRVCPGVF
jgi:protein-S-isoprenylcysteine O-methyltransferase Ste14